VPFTDRPAGAQDIAARRARPGRWLRGLLGAGLALAAAGCVTLNIGRSDTAPGGTPTSSPANMEADREAARDGLGQARPLGPPTPSRSMAEVRQQAARRLVAANPQGTYTGTPPDILLAIPVLTVELNADGSIRRIEVMRYPRQAKDTVDTAIAAVRRAAPFGDVSRLPKPWKFNETFLFNNQRKFKPMTLDR
jgi:hypothetical protein